MMIATERLRLSFFGREKGHRARIEWRSCPLLLKIERIAALKEI
jgi:hypothetical protein